MDQDLDVFDMQFNNGFYCSKVHFNCFLSRVLVLYNYTQESSFR